MTCDVCGRTDCAACPMSALAPDDYDRALMAAQDYDAARRGHVIAAVRGPLFRLNADITNDHTRAAEILTRAYDSERAYVREIDQEATR